MHILDREADSRSRVHAVSYWPLVFEWEKSEKLVSETADIEKSGNKLTSDYFLGFWDERIGPVCLA